jgi:RHS repeat-associated protein
MLMPGRAGYSVTGGWATSSGGSSSWPANLSISSRAGNAPLEYVAAESITFLEGFQSGVNDAFEAYLTQNAGGGGNSGTGAAIAGSGYRYGFNGKENDDEVKGEGAQQDYGMRIHDPRLGRFLSVDPITKEYPELTPYQFASNTPNQAVDLDGLEAAYVATSAEYMFGVWGHEVSTGFAFDKEGVALGASFGGKFGIGLSASASIGITFFPLMPDLSYMRGFAEGVTYSGALGGKAGYAYTRSSGYDGVTYSVGIGAGRQKAYIQSQSWLSNKITWKTLRSILQLSDPILINNVKVVSLLKSMGLNSRSSESEIKNTIFNKYKPQLIESVNRLIQQRKNNNSVLENQVAINQKQLDQLAKKSNLSGPEIQRKLSLQASNAELKSGIRRNNQEIQSLSNEKQQLENLPQKNNK